MGGGDTVRFVRNLAKSKNGTDKTDTDKTDTDKADK